MTKDEKAVTGKDELAATDYAVDFDLADFRGDIERIWIWSVPRDEVVDKIVEYCVERLISHRAESFEAGCAHTVKQYVKLVWWAQQIQYAARNNHVTQTWLQARAKRLDEILKELESE